MRARYYDQRVGRFTQQDSWQGKRESPLSLNKYVYANIDPVSMIDPSGYQSIGSVMASTSILSSLSTVAAPSYTSLLLAPTVGLSVVILVHDINFDIVFNEAQEAEPAKSATEEAEKQAEYDVAKDFCDNKKPRATNNSCSDLSKLIDHAEQCIAMYEDWDEKWQKGRHEEKIEGWKNRVKNIKEEHRRRCTNK